MPTLRKTFTNSSRQRDKVCNSCVKPRLHRAINVRVHTCGGHKCARREPPPPTPPARGREASLF